MQPYSGSPANLAVYFAFCQPGDTIMGLALPAGGHLTHGHTVSITGKYFKSVQYGVRKDDHRIDMDQVRDLARAHRPKLLWCGTTAYPRTLDFAAFRADRRRGRGDPRRGHRAHLGARVRRRAPVARRHRRRGDVDDAQDVPRPARRDDLLQEGARGGNRPRGVPGPAGRAAQPRHGRHRGRGAARRRGRSSRRTRRRIVENAQALGAGARRAGFGVVTGGTDNHLLLVDVTSKGVAGKPLAQALDRAGIVLNYNAVPFDPRKPFDPSGVRIGTPAVTSRGMGKDVMLHIAEWIDRVTQAPGDEAGLAKIAAEVKDLCAKYPAPGIRL